MPTAPIMRINSEWDTNLMVSLLNRGIVCHY